MRLAIISDIHGNLTAFEQCLQDMKSREIERIVNLGDCIGYGPDPEKIIQTIKNNGIVNILGNHELAAIDLEFRANLAPRVQKNLEHTLKFLSASSLEYIKLLPLFIHVEKALMVHGCPPDSPCIYLNQMTLQEIKNVFQSNPFGVSFAGHTHRTILISYKNGDVSFAPLGNNPVILEKDVRYIVNVGSAGQPRDRDPRAKYAIWDTWKHSVELRRVVYDISETAGKIIEKGFDGKDGDRLFEGK